MIDQFDAYDEDDFEPEDEPEEWQVGDCDNCYGDAGETVTNRPAGWTVCACAIGQGADPENCRCGPTASDEN